MNNSLYRPDKTHIFICMTMLVLATFFIHNSLLPSDIMESRNMVTAREMAHDGHWLIPTMNGELRLEKPPLPTWVAGVVEAISPNNLGAQRAVAGVMGCIWVMAVSLIAMRLTNGRRKLGLVTAVVMLTCYQVMLMGRTATWDIWCHATMAVACYLIMTDRWIGAGLMLGLSFMSKGPVAFYINLLPFLIAYIAVCRPTFRDRWAKLLLMLIIMAVVGGWWYAYIYLAHADVLSEVAAKESGAWSDHHVRPWHFYWRYCYETGVWAVMSVAILALPHWKKVMKDSSPNLKPYLFGLVWMVATLVLLSVLPEKKPRYLLPMMAPCAVAIASLLCHLDEGGLDERWGRTIFSINGYVIGGITTLGAIGMVAMHVMGLIDFGTMLTIAILFAMIGVAMLRATRHGGVMSFLAMVAALFITAEALLMPTIDKLYQKPYGPSLEQTRGDESLKGLQFYHPKEEHIALQLVDISARKILPLDINDPAAVEAALPCVVVTHQPAGEILSPEVKEMVKTEEAGRYNDNTHHKGNRHYHDYLITHLTILTKKDMP